MFVALTTARPWREVCHAASGAAWSPSRTACVVARCWALGSGRSQATATPVTTSRTLSADGPGDDAAAWEASGRTGLIPRSPAGPDPGCPAWSRAPGRSAADPRRQPRSGRGSRKPLLVPEYIALHLGRDAPVEASPRPRRGWSRCRPSPERCSRSRCSRPRRRRRGRGRSCDRWRRAVANSFSEAPVSEQPDGIEGRLKRTRVRRFAVGGRRSGRRVLGPPPKFEFGAFWST